MIDLSILGNYHCFDWTKTPILKHAATGGLLGTIAIVCGGHSDGYINFRCFLNMTFLILYTLLTLCKQKSGKKEFQLPLSQLSQQIWPSKAGLAVLNG